MMEQQSYKNNSSNPNKNISTGIIPYGKPCVDSAKFLVDTSLFTEVNIPEDRNVVDALTGDVLDEYKSHCLNIPYKDHKIYLGNYKKVLPNFSIDKILFYFPAKIAGDKYFSGITKELVIEVLEHLKAIGRLSFDDSNIIYKNTFLQDVDIKVDMKHDLNERDEIRAYNKVLKERFNGAVDDVHKFDSKKEGLGIQTYNRDRSTLTKPFFKFYNKSDFLITKDYEFLCTLPPKLQAEVMDNFIYRFEYTMKNKKFFDKFGISNRLEDVHEVLSEKWREIGIYFYNKNFGIKDRLVRDLSKLHGLEKKDCLFILAFMDEGWTLQRIRNLWLQPYPDKREKWRMSQKFNRIAYFATVDNEQTIEIKGNYELVKKWDQRFSDLLGFNI